MACESCRLAWVANDDLRRRNGELSEALAEVAPDHVLLSSPGGPVRAHRLHSVVDAAFGVARAFRGGRPVSGLVRELVDQVALVEGHYVDWVALQDERAKRVRNSRGVA